MIIRHKKARGLNTDKLVEVSLIFFVIFTLSLIILSCSLPFYYESKGDELSIEYYLNVIHIIENGVIYRMEWSDSELTHASVVFQFNYVFSILSTICCSLFVILTVLKCVPFLRKKIPYLKQIRLFSVIYVPMFIIPIIFTLGMLPKAFKMDIENQTGGTCEVGPCTSLNGKSDTLFWGTKSGWAVGCIAIIPSLFTSFFATVEKRRKDIKSDPETKPLLNNENTIENGDI